MADLLDFKPAEDRAQLVEQDAEQILAAVRDSEWLAEDPAGDDDYDREAS